MTRVHYREGQRLRAADLADERAYHHGRRARHLLAPHRPGIVRGLWLEVEHASLVLQPGVAVDGAGRLLVVPARHDLTAAVAEIAPVAGASQHRVVVSLVAREPSSRASFRERRACDVEGADDRPDVCFTFGDANPPPGAVIVGSIARDAAGGTEVLDEQHATFAGHFAGTVHAPRGDATLQIGARNQSDPHHVALRLHDPAGAVVERLAIGRDGCTRISGAFHPLGGQARLDLATTDPATTLRVTARRPGPDGTAITLRVIHGTVPQFTLTLSSRAVAKDEAFTGALREVMDRINAESTLATVAWIAATVPLDDVRPQETPQGVRLALVTAFPSLTLEEPLPVPLAAPLCDDGGTSAIARALGPALVFTRSTPAGPPSDLRRLAYVQRSDDDGGGRELRLEMGTPGERGDARVRSEIGMRSPV